jgi:hypothetical protein
MRICGSDFSVEYSEAASRPENKERFEPGFEINNLNICVGQIIFRIAIFP